MTTKRNGSTATREPWHRRNHAIYGGTCFTTFTATGIAATVALKIQVTVPVLLPILAAVTTVLLIHSGIRNRQNKVTASIPRDALLTQAVTGRDHERIGRPERDTILGFLADRYTHEYLNDDEYQRRHALTFQAQTRSELRAAVRGLPW